MDSVVKIFNDDVIELKLENLGDAAVNLHKPLSMIVTDMFRIEEQVFKSDGRRGGGSWKALKPETIRRKGSSQKLVESGALLKSVTVPGADYQDVHLLPPGSPDRIEFGTDRPGAAKHQYGFKPQNIPARPFIRFTPYDIVRWEKVIMDHLMASYVTGTENAL